MKNSLVASILSLITLSVVAPACSGSDATGGDDANQTECGGGPYTLDAEGKCHADDGKFASATCCPPAAKTCGGKLGASCASDEYCHYQAGAACGAGDQTGTCLPRPNGCPEFCAETMLCGCDGQLYCTECEAQSHGTDVSADGARCAAPEPAHCGGESGLTCADDEYCHYEPSQICGAADDLGTCLPRPSCPEIACLTPDLCGCDGKPYCTPCEAQANGTSIAAGTTCGVHDACSTDADCTGGLVCSCHNDGCHDCGGIGGTCEPVCLSG